MRRGLLAGLLCLALAACTAPAPGAAPPEPLPVLEPTGKPITAEDIGEYDGTARHSDNLRLVASVARRAPLNTEAALGTDLAFTGDHVIEGNYEGFTIYDIAAPEKASIVSQVYCPGIQNDVTVSGDLLFLSVDAATLGPGCQSPPYTGQGEERWEGVRIFDIKDKRAPRYVGAVATPCGSHTATLVPAATPDMVHLYVSSAPGRTRFPECVGHQGRLAVVTVPLADPAAAKLAGTPVLMPDGGTELRGNFSSGGCHDVTVYPAKKLAAAACSGDGLLLDISDPVKPKVLDRLQDEKHFGYWHSAVFSEDGTKVVFSDEFGGGLSVVCDPKAGDTLGGNGVYTVKDGKLRLRGYFKIPRKSAAPETCSAHNGSLVPVKDRDVMVQGWYEGGISVIDFSDPAAPEEIAFFERGRSPYSSPDEYGGSWSAYFYNGYIYSSDMYKGLDVLKLTGVPLEEQRLTEFNAQTQPG
ncbi:hypothetical protein [Nonomuraea sp. NPDC046570]|uniref:LVIVD repeat-containing protein n=1 Tax=Nonomuraea sp. NPDC046570 TaxID=3155255 RepID=UPI0033C73ECB